MSAQRSRTVAPAQRLRIDWPSCQGRGLCAELFPERIALDEWGFPIVLGDIPADLRERAREAVAICPHNAARLVAKS